MALELLRDIGLSKGEEAVYEALLDLGQASVTKIHEKVGIERRNIYDIINKLIERGLATYITENKKRYFWLTHPNKIIAYLEEEQQELEQTKQEVIQQLPKLVQRFAQQQLDIRAEVYRGTEGIKSVFEDMLNYREGFFIGGGGYIANKLPFYWKHYNKRRLKRKVIWYNLGREEIRGHHITKEPLMHTKFLPKEFSGNPAAIFIYGDKTANVLWGKAFFAFVIESEELAQNYKRYHKYLWENVAKP